MAVIYFENWLGNAFYDLCFAAYIERELHATGVFIEFKCFYCLQAMEKLLKAFLIHKNKITNEKTAKKYSHNISILIEDVINTANTHDLKHSICNITREYYKQLYDYKGNFMLAETVVSESFERNIQRWCEHYLIKEVKWYFYLLEQSYFETRYPFKISLPHHGDEYLNSRIFVTTIKLFKLIFSLFDKNNYDSLLQYTYSYQENSYDEMTEKTKEVLKKNEELYMYLIGKNNNLQ